MALNHVPSALAASSSFLDVKYRENLFETGVFLWALHLGPRGLAKAWEHEQATTEALYEAEQGYLLACGYDGACLAALADLGKEFRSLGVRVRGLIDDKEDMTS
ncbi:hypothetical protein BKA63DRAFT_139880 [Paraphoma chrysanthemicola]|nr:hypothetical protein BKA63DRAFT_139880 [Paraphoma chrysanthemicola]